MTAHQTSGTQERRIAELEEEVEELRAYIIEQCSAEERIQRLEAGTAAFRAECDALRDGQHALRAELSAVRSIAARLLKVQQIEAAAADLRTQNAPPG